MRDRSNFIWHHIRSNIGNSKRDKDGDLVLEDLDALCVDQCPILGIPLIYDNEEGTAFNQASADRIDSSRPYEKGNVRVVSLMANYMRRNFEGLSDYELRQLLLSVV